MSDAKITIKLDKNALRALKKVQTEALVESAIALQDVIRQEGVIPRMDNHLAGDKFTVNADDAKRGVVYLEHEGPYARRLYYHPEYNFHQSPWVDSKGIAHDGNWNAKGLWFEWWQEGGRFHRQPAELYAEALRRKL